LPKKEEKCYLRAGFMEEVVVKDKIYAFHCYWIEVNIDIPRRFLRKKITCIYRRYVYRKQYTFIVSLLREYVHV